MSTTGVTEGGRVLSIQSHVVRGYVGNKSAVFPLQLLGFDVDPILSVQFSNHTGYGSWRGEAMNGDQLWALIEGLEANDLMQYTHILTGYIGSVSFLQTIVRVVSKLREYNPNLVYVCDPVMGDQGKLYVPKDLVPAFSQVVAGASLLTPNQFEAELLTGMKIRTTADALEACRLLHDQGPQSVVITSMDLETEDGNEDLYLSILGSTRVVQDEGCPSQFIIRVRRIPSYFTGTGDLLAALLLAWTSRQPRDLAGAASKALCSLQGVLQRTAQGHSNGSPSMASRELKLIQSREEIISPPGAEAMGVQIHALE
ncbi:hypothetical protein CYMTET_41274 [Cymbomonas tetramitiformis]|uniref:pyridoxal kinase n=1 Tax=Cymbomonas tetramitiformis TaxID=36881 RepID=A0AAE0C7H3_9CHLO|nr:hypothetical protein CYMTET_41274 [Cymbomonas tetramitiformis]